MMMSSSAGSALPPNQIVRRWNAWLAARNMAKTCSHLLVAALGLAIGVAIGIGISRFTRDAASQPDAIADQEAKEIAINRVLEVVEGDRSDVWFAFQTIDRRKDGTIIVGGVLQYAFDSKAKRAENGQPPKRFWVTLIPDGNSKNWKDMPVRLEYTP